MRWNEGPEQKSNLGRKEDGFQRPSGSGVWNDSDDPVERIKEKTGRLMVIQ